MRQEIMHGVLAERGRSRQEHLAGELNEVWWALPEPQLGRHLGDVQLLVGIRPVDVLVQLEDVLAFPEKSLELLVGSSRAIDRHGVDRDFHALLRFFPHVGLLRFAELPEDHPREVHRQIALRLDAVLVGLLLFELADRPSRACHGVRSRHSDRPVEGGPAAPPSVLWVPRRFDQAERLGRDLVDHVGPSLGADDYVRARRRGVGQQDEQLVFLVHERQGRSRLVGDRQDFGRPE